ncbi:hypothetical protein HDU97_003730 [Phlyctochytrium planicorne]|nr:hypothetical protein HDU97_003730 [Phlyctochytrium planicorne]
MSSSMSLVSRSFMITDALLVARDGIENSLTARDSCGGNPLSVAQNKPINPNPSELACPEGTTCDVNNRTCKKPFKVLYLILGIVATILVLLGIYLCWRYSMKKKREVSAEMRDSFAKAQAQMTGPAAAAKAQGGAETEPLTGNMAEAGKDSKTEQAPEQK